MGRYLLRLEDAWNKYSGRERYERDMRTASSLTVATEAVRDWVRTCSAWGPVVEAEEARRRYCLLLSECSLLPGEDPLGMLHICA